MILDTDVAPNDTKVTNRTGRGGKGRRMADISQRETLA